MFRDLLSSRAILIGVVFFIGVVGSSLLYSWHVRRGSEAELARTKQAVQHLANKTGTRGGEDLGVPIGAQVLEQPEMPLVTDDTGTQRSEEMETLLVEDAENLNVADAFLPDDVVFEAASTEDGRVSPFGFGPYPKVPADYPSKMTPTWIKDENPSQDQELMHRVLIKLWNQGDHNVGGAFMSSSLVYPMYPNKVYVRYKEMEMLDGTVRRVITDAGGPLGTNPIIPPGEMFPVLPKGVEAINMDNAGINPYEFLDLR